LARSLSCRWFRRIARLGIIFNLGASAGIIGCTGCTTWTSLHAGHGLSSNSGRSVSGLELRRALGGSIHSGYGVIGARVDSNSDQSDFEVHAGLMKPMRLSERITFVPSASLELARASKIDGEWYGGAFGPALAGEFLVWASVTRQSSRAGPSLGCMGGAPGVDCPSYCRAENVVRDGFGLRASFEHDLRFGSNYPDQNDWMLWLTLGFTRASSQRERECCFYTFGQPPTGDGCR
jgi:hypothetical protein